MVTSFLNPSGNMFLTKALGHPRRVKLDPTKEYPPNPYGDGVADTYYELDAVPFYDPNRKGILCMINSAGLATPLTEYSSWANFSAAVTAAGSTAGFVDLVHRLRGCELDTRVNEYTEAVAYNEADIMPDIVTPVPLGDNLSFNWAVDANRGFLHPFAGELSTGPPDGVTYFPVVGWHGEDSSAVQKKPIVRVRFDYASE